LNVGIIDPEILMSSAVSGLIETLFSRCGHGVTSFPFLHTLASSAKGTSLLTGFYSFVDPGSEQSLGSGKSFDV
jgi:hypothetical protein